MKRLVLAVAIFGLGASSFLALQSATREAQRNLAATREAWQAETQFVFQANFERTELEARIRNLKAGLLSFQPHRLDVPAFDGDLKNLPPDEFEKLLSELGFNWNTTGDYLVVSKDTLHGISLEGIKSDRPTEAACQVLAMTPDERASLASATQDTLNQYKSWVAAHVEREEPSGNVVARYKLPADPQFSQSLSNQFVSRITGVLGEERAALFRHYSRSWMVALGLDGFGLQASDSTLTVRRYMAGDEPRLGFDLRQTGSTMTTDVNPWQPFPEAFRPAFPGGWRDLAAREGFELPKSFEKETAK